MMKTLYSNPTARQRVDPWVYKHIDGYCYFTGSVLGYQVIELRRAKSLNGLEHAASLIVWQAHEEGPMSESIWASEAHYINGKWYIHFIASSHKTIRDKSHHHRMFVLESQYIDPVSTDWIEKGQIKTKRETFSLDGTTFSSQEKLHYVWVQQDPEITGNSNLYLPEMDNPWTLKGKQILLSIPEHEQGKRGFSVNEGLAVLTRNGKMFITYFGSATDEDYAMGLLWVDEYKDLLLKGSWYELSEPVLVSSEKDEQFGPGHNSFMISGDGCFDILIYYARPEKNQKGDPLDNPNWHTNAQCFTWNEQGFPELGESVLYAL